MALPPSIAELITELEVLRAKRDDHWQIPRTEGEVLYQIAVASGAKVIVEAGTSYGFSGLFWAAAVQQTEGRLHTIDMDPKKVESSKETFVRAGVAERVTNHLGRAEDVLLTLAGPIDIVFLDCGDKKAMQPLFELVWPKVRLGGSVITDNIATHRNDLAGLINHVRALPNAVSTEVLVGNGIEWTIKVGG